MKRNILLILINLGISFLSAQNCNSPSAYAELNINNIKAGLLNGGDMWWDGASEARYTYPNDSNPAPNNLAFNGSIWLTAKDSNDSLKCSAQLYRTNGFDFWTGPIQNNGPWVEDSVCSKFDRFFEVYKTEVCTHINNIHYSNLPLSINTISTNIKEWPGKGNQYLLNTYGMHIDEDLAPFEDSNNNGIYDPQNGDYPLSKGDQCIFWVINDIGYITHTNSGGDALGVEIQCMAYAYATNNAVNDATFYDYTIIKKTLGNLNNFYFSKQLDSDLLDASNDYIGCDTILDFGFTYNPDNSSCFAAPPPIFIIKFKKTPGKGLSSFMPFVTGSILLGEPTIPKHFRNYQTGKWKNGNPLVSNNGQYNGAFSSFAFPGNPGGVDNKFSECFTPSTPGDRKYIMSSGPYDLIQNQALNFTISAIVVPTTSPLPILFCPDKTTLINPVINFIDNFLDTVNNIKCSVLQPSAISDISENSYLLNIYPNPTTEKLYLDLDASLNLAEILIYDTKGAIIKAELKGNIIDVSDFPKGIYTLKAYDQSKTIVKKFVVE